jgi:hypothetical protein
MLQQTKYCVCVCVCVCLCGCVCVCVCVCLCDYLLCVGKHYKIKFVTQEIMVRSSRMFQLISVRLGCAIYQTILLVELPLSVDGAKLQTVSTAFLLFHSLIWKTAHIRMTVSKGKKLTEFRKLCGHSEYLLFILWHAECKDCPRLYSSVIWTGQLELYIQ